MQIKIMSRKEATETVFPNDPRSYAVISIYTPGDKPPELNAHPPCVLRLAFHDCDEKTGDFQGHKLSPAQFKLLSLQPITEEQAKIIATYLLLIHERENKEDFTLFIHCDAGRSRSRGVGAAACIVFGLDDTHIYRGYTPNADVKSKIMAQVRALKNVG